MEKIEKYGPDNDKLSQELNSFSRNDNDGRKYKVYLKEQHYKKSREEFGYLEGGELLRIEKVLNNWKGKNNIPDEYIDNEIKKIQERIKNIKEVDLPVAENVNNNVEEKEKLNKILDRLNFFLSEFEEIKKQK